MMMTMMMQCHLLYGVFLRYDRGTNAPWAYVMLI